MKKIYFNFHWSFLLLGIFLIIFGKGGIFLCYVIFGILHEIAHSLVGKRLGYKLNIITMMPYGASLSGNNSPLKPIDEIEIALAGPLFNMFMVVLAIFLKHIGLNCYEILDMIASVNMSYLIFNLLPVFPLDGGRILLAILSIKLKRKTSMKIVFYIGLAITLGCFVLFFISLKNGLNYMLGINALFLLIGLFNDDKTAYYINIKTLSSASQKINKGGLVKTFAVMEDANLFSVYKLLDKYNINQILVFDNNNNLKTTIMDFDLEKYLLSKPLDTKIKDVINNVM